MEVLMGPTFTIDAPSSPPPEEGVPSFRISAPPKFFAGGESEPESSSSIGTPDDSDNEEEEEVQSEFKRRTGLGSLDALEDSLPIKLVPFSSFC
ncbi:hypothetical protein SESBI_14562 [Sesbania bispinosa]|nr:hypothetical protein SESBI_14562 [Sesbania bispinosa]